jgi:hypothetical protein
MTHGKGAAGMFPQRLCCLQKKIYHEFFPLSSTFVVKFGRDLTGWIDKVNEIGLDRLD